MYILQFCTMYMCTVQYFENENVLVDNISSKVSAVSVDWAYEIWLKDTYSICKVQILYTVPKKYI